MARRNRPKWTISTSSGFGLLQMVLEPDTKRCANVDIGPQKGWIVKSYIGEENETLIIKVWKPLSSRRILKL